MNYVIASFAAVISVWVANEQGLPYWPALSIFLIGFASGKVTSYFAKTKN